MYVAAYSRQCNVFPLSQIWLAVYVALSSADGGVHLAEWSQATHGAHRVCVRYNHSLKTENLGFPVFASGNAQAGSRSAGWRAAAAAIAGIGFEAGRTNKQPQQLRMDIRRWHRTRSATWCLAARHCCWRASHLDNSHNVNDPCDLWRARWVARRVAAARRKLARFAHHSHKTLTLLADGCAHIG